MILFCSNSNFIFKYNNIISIIFKFKLLYYKSINKYNINYN